MEAWLHMRLILSQQDKNQQQTTLNFGLVQATFSWTKQHVANGTKHRSTTQDKLLCNIIDSPTEVQINGEAIWAKQLAIYVLW